MKIAEVIAVFPPFHGGMGYICFHNTRELARRGHDVTVFTLGLGRSRFETDPSGFRIERLGTPLRYGDGGVVPQLAWKLRGFDIVHLHYPFFGGAEYVYLASRLWGRRYFLTYHMDVYGNDALKRLAIGAYEPLLMKRIIRGASLVTGPGREYLNSTKAGGLFDWDKVVEAGYGGVDVTRYSPREKNPALLRKYGLEGKAVVLFAGNLQPFKGLHLLIDAVAGIDDKDIALLVVGGGYGEESYRKQVREKGLEERVVFAGPQSPEGALPDHFNLGDFLVLPSTHSESFGLVVLEAMASGKPAIVSALPGPSRLVEDGVDGLIVRIGDVGDLVDKIGVLRRDPARCREMGARAREKVVRKYRWEAIGENLEKAFRNILAR